MTETDDLLQATQRVVSRNYGRWSQADQEDLVSVVLEKYWKTFGEGDGPDNRGAWLTTVAQNAARDLADQRARRLSDPFGDPAEVMETRPLASADLTDWLRAVKRSGPSVFAVRHDLLDKVLGLVDEADRDLIVRKYLEGWAARDLAVEMGVGVDAVNQRLYRARRQLEAKLAEQPELLAELRSAMSRMY